VTYQHHDPLETVITKYLKKELKTVKISTSGWNWGDFEFTGTVIWCLCTQYDL